MHFRTTIIQSGKTATGIHVPDEIVAALGPSRKPAVRVTLNGYTYRNTIASMSGRFMVSVSADIRAKAKVAGGDVVDVELELDTEPREVSVPVDFRKALDQHPEAAKVFDGLAYSHKLRHVLAIEGAKAPETRQRRIDKAIEVLGGQGG